jgi:hypothetical protein
LFMVPFRDLRITRKVVNRCLPNNEEKLACHLEPDFTMLRGIGGTLVPTLYKTTLRNEREGTKFMINFYVVEHSLLKLDAILD